MRHLHGYTEPAADFKQLALGVKHLIGVRADMRGNKPPIVPAG